MLNISLFGEFQCLLQGQPVSALYTVRLRSLLAYLLLHRTRPVLRQQLAYAFWPESNDGQARTNLRNLLAQLRSALPDADRYLFTDTQVVQWRADAPYTLDVADFEAALALAHQTQEPALKQQQLESALRHYQGDLFANQYEDWLEPLRADFHNHYLQTLEEVSAVLEQQRHYGQALAVTQRLLQIDPLCESTYARLMSLHAAVGDRATALRLYHTCATTLLRELGVEPSAPTRQVYERLLHLEEAETTPVAVPASSTLVGRAAAWGQVQTAWQRASRGQPHLLLISGEAGIGKSRLAEELVEWVRRQGMTVAIAHCYSAAGRLAFAPILDWLRSGAFQAALAALDPAQRADLARLLPEVGNQATPPPPTFSSDAWQRQRLFDVMARVIAGQGQPLLLLIDDLQWCDAETLDWLHYLLHYQPRARLLVMGTVRSEELAANQPLRQLMLQLQRTDLLTEAPLARLDRQATLALAATLVDHTFSPDEAEAFYAQTEGNPLFIVETIRTGVVEQAVANQRLTTQNATALPAKVQAVIETRLARLSSPARSLVDVAAVIGRSFTLAVLALVSEQNEATLILGLDELWQSKIVVTPDGDVYDFSHDKLREVARNGLSPAWRRLLHQRVAQALTKVAADDLDRVSAQLAYHYEQSKQSAQAVQAYQRAAHVAQRLCDLDAAIGFLQQALTLLPQLTNPASRSHSELAIQTSLAALYFARRGGYAAPEVEQSLRRAQALVQESSDPAQRFSVLMGVVRFYMMQPNFVVCREIGLQLLTIGQQTQAPAHLCQAYNILGCADLFRGQVAAACAHFQQGLAAYQVQPNPEQAPIDDHDPQPMIILVRLACALWLLGEGVAAKAHCQSALTMLQKQGAVHPYGRALVIGTAALFYQLTGDVTAVQELAQAAVTLAEQHGFLNFLGMFRQLLGWAWVMQGQGELGYTALQQGLASLRTSGAQALLPYFAMLHATAAAHTGRLADGLAALEQGLTVVNQSGEWWMAPTLHRLKGDILLAQDRLRNADAAQSAHSTAHGLAEQLGIVVW